MGSMNLPFIGAAVPILAAISALTTYLTSKMTCAGQPVNEWPTNGITKDQWLWWCL